MEYSKKIKKSGLFYYRRKRILERWMEENCLSQSETSSNNPEPSASVEEMNPLKKVAMDAPSDDYFPDVLEADFCETKSVTAQSTVEDEWINGLPSADELDSMNLEESLRYWALKTNQSHLSINMILDIIRKKTDGNQLPRCARSLLKTSRNATKNITEIGGGQYWYYGIKNCLSDYYRDIDHPLTISINVNIDGIPIYKSSKAQFWPILFNIFEQPEVKPMTIAIFLGTSKPESIEEFLRPFVNELTDVLNHGLCLNGHQITVQIRCIICDSPARAFIKGVYGFNSKNGCLKCVCEGEYCYESRTVIFTSLNCANRTDRDFRQNAYTSHQKTTTPLIDIPNLDLIKNIIVGDRLHLIDLGVMKRLLLGWRDGTLGFTTKLSAQQINGISAMLRRIRLPSEIHRKFRGLDCITHWKGTEFNNFLHYGSIVVLKKYLPADAYQHFLLFYCSITMLSSNCYRPNWHVARIMLEKFITDFMTIYGRQYITSNIHNLQHIVDEAEIFGPLSTMAAYPFENGLQCMKHLIRSGFKTLEQVVSRLSEVNANDYYKTRQSTKKFPFIKIGKDYVRVELDEGFLLDTSHRNGWFLTRSNQVVRFSNATLTPSLLIQGKIVLGTQPFFQDPFTSSVLHVFRGNIERLPTAEFLFNIQMIKCKLVAVESIDDYVFIPLLHTLK